MLALDANTTRQASSGTSDSFSHTCSTKPNRALFVIAILHGTSNPTNVSASYAGVSMTKLGEHRTVSDNVTLAVFELKAPATGANTVALSWTGTGAGQIIARSYTGVHQGTPTRSGSYTSALFNDTTPSISVPSAVGDIVVDGMGFNTLGSSTATVGSGQTQIWSVEANSMRTAFSWEDGSAGSVTMSWTVSFQRSGAHAGYSIMPATPGGGIAVSPAMIF